MPSPLTDFKSRLSEKALSLGFFQCGVASADAIGEETERRFAEWLSRGYHAGMDYLARDPEARGRPRELLPGAESIICLSARYASGGTEKPDPAAPVGQGRIARYARGEDYHRVLDSPLRELEDWIKAEGGAGTQTRRFCDAGPLLERQFAERAGLGFIGKNTLLITPESGSWVLLCAVITSLEIPPDAPGTGTCGNCTRCLDACPTNAFPEAGALDSRRCISNLTIEKRGEFSPEESQSIGDWLFGCDICQEVCPYNKAPVLPSFPELDEIRFPDGTMDLKDLLQYKTNRPFEKAFAHSPLQRPRRKGLWRNARAVARNQGENELARKFEV